MEQEIVQPLEALTRLNVLEFVEAFGLRPGSPAGRALAWATRRAGRRFARMLIDFDSGVGAGGLRAGADRLLAQLGGTLTVAGAEHAPAHGPALFLSNHPGLADTLALFHSIPRSDLRIIALDRPFLRALPHTSRRLIFVPEGTEGRMDVVRAASRALRAGEALLTFPAGEIEPDPAVMPGAEAALAGWSASIAVFARMAPETLIVPALVSGVIAGRSLRHPLACLRPAGKPRERLAATLQVGMAILRPGAWATDIEVRFGAPLCAGELAALRDPAAITAQVTNAMARLVREREQRTQN